MAQERTKLAGLARRLSRDRGAISLLEGMLDTLDDKYALLEKIAQEPRVEDVVQQMAGRLLAAYGDLARLGGQRVLDLACGSNSSKSPAFVYVNTPQGEKSVRIAESEELTAMFEPWLCRMLVELGAEPVGIDMGDLEGEAFEHYSVDLSLEGSLDFLPSHSFDAANDSRLFGSPEFRARFADRAVLRVAHEVRRQEQRLLKAGGILIHSDAKDLVGV